MNRFKPLSAFRDSFTISKASFNLTRLRALFQGAVHKGGSLRRKVLANKNQATRTHGAHVRRSPRLQHASRNDESPKERIGLRAA